MQWLIRAVLLPGLCAATFPALAADQVLRIHGSNTIGERLAPALVDAWFSSRGYTDVEHLVPASDELTLRARGSEGHIEVQLRAHGSSTGMSDLLAAKTDIAMSSRPANTGELERIGGVQEVVVALDGVVVIVHPDNPLRRLRVEDVRRVFAGQVRDGAQIGATPGRIALHARDDNSGTWETFRTLVMGSTPLRRDARRYESTQALAAAVAADRNAIGFVGLAGIDRARAIAIADAGEALAPSRFSVAVEDYALARRLYFYRFATPSPLAEDFLQFVVSAAGQQVVADAGFVSQQIQAVGGPLRADVPPEYQTLVGNAQRLSLNFRFGTGSSLLDSKAQQDLDRLDAFLRLPRNRDRPLLLLGFSDASETAPYLALTLSNDRVDFISQRLQQRGIAVSRARGMGGSAPVASNETPHGRHRNRRVEVWLGAAGEADSTGIRRDAAVLSPPSTSVAQPSRAAPSAFPR